MIRTNKWKLVYLPMQEGAVYWLFDVINDAESRYDVSSLHPDVVGELKHMLIAWMTEDKDRQWHGEHLVSRYSD